MGTVDALERWERCMSAVEQLALIVEQLATDVEATLGAVAPEVANAALRPGARGAARLSARSAAVVAERCREILDDVGEEWRGLVRDLPADKRTSSRLVLLDEHEDLLGG